MYNGFYNLKQDPFRLTPDPDFLYVSEQYREAFAGLVYSVCTRPGLTVLVGEAGTGKTTLLYALTRLLEKRRSITAVCTNPTLSREEFYDLLLNKLGVECPSSLKSRQLLALQESLTRNRADGKPSVLIVDEAQRLPTELLEEIRLLLNFETPREKLLEIIIAGQPELLETLRRPELRQLKQRVSYFCKLEPLQLNELREYLHHRLARAGLRDQAVFPEATIPVVHEYTRGIPRLVNTLCDGALRNGLALQSQQITVAIIRDAAKELDLQPVSDPAPEVSPKGMTVVPVRSVRPPAAGAAAAAATAAAAVGEIPLNGDQAKAPIPLESYATRQKSVSFLGSLMERWK